MPAYPRNNQVKYIVLDFDGTCTQIPAIQAEYLELFRHGFAEHIEHLLHEQKYHRPEDKGSHGQSLIAGGPLTEVEWRRALEEVRRHSPVAGWMLGGCSAAPAAADPYILADESAKLVLRRRGMKNPSLPPTINGEAYAAVPAPWRPETREVFQRLVNEGIKIFIVSNSSTEFIEGRLKHLLGNDADLLQVVSVHSDAGKFLVRELAWDDSSLSVDARAMFAALSAVSDAGPDEEPERPIYLRRGAYFEAICRVLGGDLAQLKNTVFCGDIWEMDLAMPFALGANVHLLERAPPFPTYPYEKAALAACRNRGLWSSDLSGLLMWLDRGSARRSGAGGSADSPAAVQENTADRVKRLEFYYAEHAEQARQHENQRERMTNLVLGVAGALIGVMTFADLAVWSLPAALAVTALGAYGLVFARKHYERNRYHVSIMREIRKEMEYACGTMLRPFDVPPNRTLDQIRKAGVRAHYANFGREDHNGPNAENLKPTHKVKRRRSYARCIIRLRLHQMWEGFHWLILGLGAFFCIVVLTKWMMPSDDQPLRVQLITGDTTVGPKQERPNVDE
ncbi:HAD family hydrolase [Lacipirellula parvula]|uniref:Uncharacterized protein n=1 Tax=Lacipirellula parvula TaxID=2650471 RepID=A0A5K7X809_9BACT|nr:HAD family hydrolase [Lacipirellula parvula]BBO30446.1 hypothetical protein PLANPX_0058 [Lacipirellula parvula]